MKLTNPNKKGNLGEIAVCKELLQLGYQVFTELGSDSKVDLIILDENYQTIKIQVKSIESKQNVVTIYSIKSCLNPKYNSSYTIQQIDVFAVYVIDQDFVFYVSAKELLKNSKASKFRLIPAKNGQSKNVRFAKDYLNFEKALRDYTPHTLTAKTVGDEIVQTTTLLTKAASES